MHRRLAAALLLSLLSCNHSGNSAAIESKEFLALKQRVQKFDEKLERVRAMAAATEPAQKCLLDEFGQASLSVPLVDYEYLAFRHRMQQEPDATVKERWRFLTSSHVRTIAHAKSIDDVSKATDTVFEIQKLEGEHPVVAVVRTTKRSLPRLEQRRFVTGEFQGQLFLFRISDGRLLCGTSLLAHSSEEVASAEGTAPEQALWRDFALAVRSQLERAAAELSPQVSLDLE